MKNKTWLKVILIVIVILVIIIIMVNKKDESFNCSKAESCVLNIDGSYSCFTDGDIILKTNVCDVKKIPTDLVESSDNHFDLKQINYFKTGKIIYFYEKNDDDSYFYDTKEVSEDEAIMIGIYTCKTDSCYVYDIAGSYALLEDNGIFIYAINDDRKVKEIDGSNNISIMKLVIDKNGNLVGLINGKKQGNNEVDQFYSLDKDKVLIDYDSNVTIDYNRLVVTDGYLFVKNGNDSYLFDLKTSMIMYKNITGSLFGINSYYYYYEKNNKYEYIYDNNFNTIKENVDTAEVTQDDNLVISSDNKTYTYNQDGKQIN